MINFIVIENWLTNISFFLLFCTTLYYWIKIIFSNSQDYTKTGLIGIIFTNLLITIQLVIRWVDSGHFPLSNLYESLLFLSWGLLFFYAIIENQIKTRLLGLLVCPAILCLICFTSFSLPQELQQAQALVPALQSNWLIMHVSVMILSYASLLLGCLLAISYIILYFVKQQNLPISSISLNTNLPDVTSDRNDFTSSFVQKPDRKFSKIFELLDNLSYRIIGFGFCLLTLGILSGAIWANETWGSYWSWDPKETWALITWLIFAIYLHTRFIQGLSGLKPAQIASFGFFIIWVCYLGVNLLGKGLHSYGFLTN